jgi:sulfur carrier protein ThiS
MEIEIRLFHGLGRYLPPGEGAYSRLLEVPPGSTADQVLADIGLPDNPSFVLMVGGKPAKRDQVLLPGDSLTVMLPAGGG